MKTFFEYGSKMDTPSEIKPPLPYVQMKSKVQNEISLDAYLIKLISVLYTFYRA